MSDNKEPLPHERSEKLVDYAQLVLAVEEARQLAVKLRFTGTITLMNIVTNKHQEEWDEYTKGG